MIPFPSLLQTYGPAAEQNVSRINTYLSKNVRYAVASTIRKLVCTDFASHFGNHFEPDVRFPAA